MGVVIPFPSSARNHGIVHVMPCEDGGYEVGHESTSGDSWGNFHSFASAAKAVAFGSELNQRDYGGQCEVYIWIGVQRALAAEGAG